RGVEGGVGVGVLGDLGGQVGGDLGDLVAGGVADVEGFLEHGRVHPAQTVSGGRAGLGLHLVAQAGDVRAVASQRQLPVGRQGADACIDLLRTDLQRAQVVRDGQAVASEAGDPHVVLDQQDRKSTRLNSSHVSISYAVFCLKKKKKLYNILLL